MTSKKVNDSMSIKRIVIVCVLVFYVSISWAKSSTELKRYTGNNFAIEYPAEFSARAGKKHSRDDYQAGDEAFFTSPDKYVEFFVYSPLWDGKPDYYLEVAKTEILLDEKISKTKNNDPFVDKALDQKITHWLSVKAKDDSYFRSFVHTSLRSSDASLKIAGIDTVFGIKYKNKQSYDKYKTAYIAFKQSLQKVADDGMVEDADITINYGNYSVVGYISDKELMREQTRILYKDKLIWNSEKINLDGAYARLVQDDNFERSNKGISYQFVDLTGNGNLNLLLETHTISPSACCSETYLLEVDKDKLKILDKIPADVEICQLKRGSAKRNNLVLISYQRFYNYQKSRRDVIIKKQKVTHDGFQIVSDKSNCWHAFER